jgi:hypothetical protein
MIQHGPASTDCGRQDPLSQIGLKRNPEELSMNFSAPFVVAAALLLAAEQPKQEPREAPVPYGWTIATEGSGIPTGQNASEYATGVDRDVTHGGKAAISMRSIVSKPATFRSVTQFVKADAYRGKRVCLAG